MRRRGLSFLSSNLGTKVISVVIAGVLWSVVLGSRTVEVTKDVPLEVITSPDVVPSNDLPEKVSFRLAGPKAFLRAILDRREDPIRINLVGASPGLVTHRFFSDNIRVPIGVKVVSVSPAALLIRLERLERKEVAVKAEIRGSPPSGFHLEGFEITPPTLRIKGASSRVENLTEVVSLPIDLSTATGPIERELNLDLGRLGVQADQPLPRIRIQVVEDPEHLRQRSSLPRGRLSPR
jgi:YbbR domain-containing protein